MGQKESPEIIGQEEKKVVNYQSIYNLMASIVLDGVVCLNDSKVNRAKKTAGKNASEKDVLILYDKFGGAMRKESGEVIPMHTFWNEFKNKQQKEAQEEAQEETKEEAPKPKRGRRKK